MSAIHFIGLGAIGGTFARQFFDHNYEVNVICDEDRKNRYIKEGFYINNKRYDFNYLTPNDANLKANFLFVAVKHHHLKEILPLIKPYVSKNTVIVSLMNGILSEEFLKKHFEKSPIVHAFVKKVDALKEGNTIYSSLPGTIVFGQPNTTRNTTLDTLEQLFQSSEINYERPSDILKEQWWKFMVNVGINQISAILKAQYGEFKQNSYARKAFIQAMEEVITIAEAKNISLGKQPIERFLALLDQLSDTGKTSMLQDMEAQRKTEVEMLSQVVSTLGEELQIDTPINDFIFLLIKAFEKKNNAVE